ncbi:MAG: DUF421 domain-containing protein [Oscillospiraceae bacterium]
MDILKTALCAVLSIVVLFVITKLIGHRQISQLDLFDYINGITIGSIAAELATELENPERPLTAMIIYGLFAIILSILTSKHSRLRKYVNGTPTIIYNDGKLYRKNMKKAKLDLSEFLVMCRQAGYFDLGQLQTAVFEYNGRMTFLPKSENRPLTPVDMSIAPQRAEVFTEVIMDGRILDANLRSMNRDVKWLENQLRQQKFNSASEVFLGLCDSSGNLSLYAMEPENG